MLAAPLYPSFMAKHRQRAGCVRRIGTAKLFAHLRVFLPATAGEAIEHLLAEGYGASPLAPPFSHFPVLGAGEMLPLFKHCSAGDFIKVHRSLLLFASARAPVRRWLSRSYGLHVVSRSDSAARRDRRGCE